MPTNPDILDQYIRALDSGPTHHWIKNPDDPGPARITYTFEEGTGEFEGVLTFERQLNKFVDTVFSTNVTPLHIIQVLKIALICKLFPVVHFPSIG